MAATWNLSSGTSGEPLPRFCFPCLFHLISLLQSELKLQLDRS